MSICENAPKFQYATFLTLGKQIIKYATSTFQVNGHCRFICTDSYSTI